MRRLLILAVLAGYAVSSNAQTRDEISAMVVGEMKNKIEDIFKKFEPGAEWAITLAAETILYDSQGLPFPYRSASFTGRIAMPEWEPIVPLCEQVDKLIALNNSDELRNVSAEKRKQITWQATSLYFGFLFGDRLVNVSLDLNGQATWRTSVPSDATPGCPLSRSISGPKRAWLDAGKLVIGSDPGGWQGNCNVRDPSQALTLGDGERERIPFIEGTKRHQFGTSNPGSTLHNLDVSLTKTRQGKRFDFTPHPCFNCDDRNACTTDLYRPGAGCVYVDKAFYSCEQEKAKAMEACSRLNGWMVEVIRSDHSSPEITCADSTCASAIAAGTRASPSNRFTTVSFANEVACSVPGTASSCTVTCYGWQP
jgi:hypothetical protein